MQRVSNAARNLGGGNLNSMVADTTSAYTNMNSLMNSIDRSSSATVGLISKINELSGAIDEVANSFQKADREADDLSDDVDDVADSSRDMQRLSSSVDLISNAFQKAAQFAKDLYEAAKKVTDWSDNLQGIQNRLSLVTEAGETVADMNDQIIQGALNSRTEYESFADSVSKLKIRTNGLFDTKEAVAFSEVLNDMMNQSGASGTERYSTMLQTIQALGSGRLQGDELHSLYETAPQAIQAISEYTGIAQENIRTAASEGVITAETVKNAILSKYSEITSATKTLPMTFSQAWTNAQTEIMKALLPVQRQLNTFANSPEFKQFVSELTVLAVNLANVLLKVLDGAVKVFNFISQNWSVLKPIIIILSTAVLALAAAIGIAKIQLQMYEMVQAGVSKGMFAIFGVVGIVIGAIAALINYVGGAANAFDLLKTAVMVAGEFFKWLGMVIYDWGATASGYIIDFANSATVWMNKIKFSIINAFLTAFETVANFFQNFVNGIISGINFILSGINKIAGTDFHIDNVTFGDQATQWADAQKKENDDYVKMLETNAALIKQQHNDEYAKRQSDIANQWNQVTGTAGELADKWVKYTNEAKQSQDATAMNDAMFNYTPDLSQGISIPDYSEITPQDSAAAKETAENTKKTAEEVSKSNQDMQYLYDIASRRATQRVTNLSPTVSANVYVNQISEDKDLDGIANYLSEKLWKSMTLQPEGVYNV